MKKVELLFDCVRSPYDIAHIIQVANALDCNIYTVGNSISFDSPKVKQKVRSWNITGDVNVVHYESFEEAVTDLRKKGRYLVGTSGNVEKSYYDLDFSDKLPVIIFGTESSGLTNVKQSFLDDVVKMPMRDNVDFLTLPVVVSAIAYDLYRQFNL